MLKGNSGPQTPLKNPVQVIVDIRKKAKVLAANLGVDNFELEIQDIKHLLFCRALGHGTMTLSVTKGVPSVSLHTEERIDYSKEMLFE